MGKIMFGNLDPQSTNLPVDGTSPQEDPKKKFAEVAQDLTEKKQAEAMQTATDNMEQDSRNLDGNVNIANSTPTELRDIETPEGRSNSRLGQDAEVNPYASAISDLNRNWLQETAKGFTRGVGQSISSTGDVINFFAAAAPWWTMNEGTMLGNSLNKYGDAVESENMTYVKQKMDEQKMTFSSFADVNFWTSQVSELIPLALEFLAAGSGFAKLGGRAAAALAETAGERALAKGVQSVAMGAEELATGSKKFFDIGGTGKGLYKHLLRNADGIGQATELGITAGEALGGGLGTNLLSGAMNGMQLYKQMKAESEAYAKKNDGKVLYTDDEMSTAAAATFARNSEYLAVDSLSWGISFGKFGGKLAETMGIGEKTLKSSADTLKQNSTLFAANMASKGKMLSASANAGRGAIKVGGMVAHAAFEGVEEMFQETFENWAQQKSKAKATGAEYQNYADYFMSDENRKTLVLSAASGGLMGGLFNIKADMNKEAEAQHALWDRQANLKASMKINDETGQTMRDWHIQNTLFDIANQGKEDLFEPFVNDMVDKGTIEPEHAVQLSEDFKKIKEAISFAGSLNIKGKMVLAQETISKNEAAKAIEFEKAKRLEDFAVIRQEIQDPVAQQRAIDNRMADSHETIKALGMKLAMHEANRLNLISNREAVPVGNKVVISRDGKERIMAPTNYEVGENTNKALNEGYLVAGLSHVDYQEYMQMTNQQLFDRAKTENETASRNLKGRAKDIFRDFMKKEEAELNPDAETENEELTPDNEAAEVNPDIQEIHDLKQAKEEFTAPIIEQQVNEGVDLETATAEAEKQWTPQEAILQKENEEIQKSNEEIIDGAKAKGIGTEDVKRDVDNETNFEKEAIDNPEYGKDKKSLADKKKEDTAAAEESFKNKENPDDVNAENDSGGTEQATAEPDYTIAPDGNGFVVNDADGKPLENAQKKPRKFLNSTMAQNAIDKIKKEMPKGGKALLGKVFGKRKSKANPAEQSTEERHASILKENKIKQHLRKSVIHNALNNANLEAEIATSPEVETYHKAKLDAYLQSVLPKWQYGPTVVNQQRALNRHFKAMGIPVTVTAFSNLMDTIGVDAVGYVVGSGVFIDEKEWNHNETFMHEMSHVWYRVMADTPEAKAVITNGRTNKELVKQIENDYADLVMYDVQYDENGPFFQKTKQEIEDEIDDNMEDFPFKNIPEKSADENQKYINEEIFTNTLQGPLSKTYNKFFEPIGEIGRQKVSTSLWAHIRNKTITYSNSNDKVMQSLNDGKPVQQEDLLDFVMTGFDKSIIDKNSLTTRGFARRISKINAEQQAQFDAINEGLAKTMDSINPDQALSELKQSAARKRLQKTIDSIHANENLTEDQRTEKINEKLDQFENSIYEDGGFEDSDLVTMNRIKGATKLLNDYASSMTYIKRQRDIRNKVKPGDMNNQSLSEFREDLVSEFFEAAQMAKGNSAAFIDAVKNSEVFEVSEFYNYLDKTAPDIKDLLLHEMSWVMGSTKSISSIKSYVNNKGEHILENALSEREVHWRESKVRSIKKNKLGNFYSESEEVAHENFKTAVRRIQNRTQSQEDYLSVFNYIAPYQVQKGKILNDGGLNYKGEDHAIERVLKAYAVNPANFDANGNPIINNDLKAVLNSILDTNRKFTSRSVVANAEGNNITTRITNNNLVAEIDHMGEFLNTKIKGKTPTFKQFKEEFGHALDSSKRTVENPVLRKVYNDITSGRQAPGLVQYLGNNNQKSGKKTLYKNSNALTQTLEDFLMFNKSVNGKASPNEYLQNMGAFADSPRKFMFSVPRLKADLMFNEKGFTGEGKKMINTAFTIYQDSNKGIAQDSKEYGKIYKTPEEFTTALISEMNKEMALMNENGAELSKNASFAKMYSGNTLNADGEKAIKEFTFNSVVNGISMNEIFNPGVPSGALIKRNKGNSSPVMTHGNRNVKMNYIFVNDSLFNENKAGKLATDSGMYILEKNAAKYTNLGQLIYPLNDGLKLMGYNVERDNPNFKGQTAYIKGYTRVINEESLIKEPGLRPIYDMLMAQDAKLESEIGQTSNNLMDGNYNAVSVLVPTSSIKSSMFSAEQQADLRDVTFDNLSKAHETHQNLSPEEQTDSDWSKYMSTIEKMNRNEANEFVGFDGYNFGPQQVMDKTKFDSITPVQMISAMIVNSNANGNLGTAEEIQSLIRKDMDNNMDKVLAELKDLNPKDYKNFILKHLDLEAMDQIQRFKIEDSVNNLSHTALGAFVQNTLANALKFSGNKLKTAGSVSQQIPAIHYRLPNGYTVNGSNKIRGFQDKTVQTVQDGKLISRTGTQPLEIVLGKHMEGRVKPRQYFEAGNVEMLADMSKRLKGKYEQAATYEEQIAVIKEYVKEKASSIHPPVEGKRYNVNDHIGSFEIDGATAGYFVRGENVLATRVPSDGPHSTGVFEVIDFSSAPGNQAMVSEEFNEVIGSDYDGDALFIQHKSKATPNFNKALDLIAQQWGSAEMYNLIREKIEFEDDVKKILSNIKADEIENSMPSSPANNRNGFNNTMVSKRSIGKAFNVHRLANYFANYDVKVSEPITINGKKKEGFTDEQVDGKSRVLRSAIVANIILDNSTYHFADKLGINDQTLSAVMLLTNMNFSLEDIAKIMNSDAAKSWVKHSQQNQSPYMDVKKINDIKNIVYGELGIVAPKANDKISINTADINSLHQKSNVISLLTYLESVNSEVMTVSKIMAGHKGIEANPFVLENQIKEFGNIIHNNENPDARPSKLLINDGFKNNPDIVAYERNAKKILDTLKKADKIYNTNTAKIMDELNSQVSLFGLDEGQLQRASKALEGFYTSRILGLNNISALEKENMKNDLMKDINLYQASLNYSGNNKQSLLFTKALAYGQSDFDINMDEDYVQSDKNNSPLQEKAYLYADPAFFNDSLTPDERDLVRREFEELPADIKNKMIVYDLLAHNLTGPRSLVHIFDGDTDAAISNAGAYQQVHKNNTLAPEVKAELKRLLILNEFYDNEGKIPYINNNLEFVPENFEKIFNKGFRARFENGKPFYIKMNGELYSYNPNRTVEEMAEFSQAYKKAGYSEKMKILGARIMKPGNFTKIKTGVNTEGKSKETIMSAINARIKSIADIDPNMGTTGTFIAKESNNYDNAVDYMVEANTVYEEAKKKSPRGKAHKIAQPEIDYHNYNDYSPLSKVHFDATQNYKEKISDGQKQLLYEDYLADKDIANRLSEKINFDSVKKMTFSELDSLYKEYATKGVYAYSIITTPVMIEVANRNASEQSVITNKFEDGKDMSVIGSYFDNNNIPSNHPATQALVRQINTSYKKFIKERAKYIQRINDTTEALYKEKFGLSDIKPIRFLQKAWHSIFGNRAAVYDLLYGGITEKETVKNQRGFTVQNFKLKTPESVQALYNTKQISKAEYDFYNMFRETTKEFEKFSGTDKIRKDYIPHTAMSSMEIFSTRGLLGLMVNSKGINDAINDVQLSYEKEGKKEMVYFSDIKNIFNSMAVQSGNKIDTIKEFQAYKKKAQELLKQGINEDGTAIDFTIQNMTMADMSPMSRFANSRSAKAELMPSMDLNKALVDYVHTSLFVNGNNEFEGFKSMMPLIDGVFAYNDKNGYKNAAAYVKEVIKEKFILKRDQDLFGKTPDKIINGFVKGNLLYALGYKGFLVGKGMYAVGNVAIGKYMNVKRDGGKAWLKGEGRYWGVDQGFSVESMNRRQRTNKILHTLGFMEMSMYDDVSIEKKTGLDGIFTNLALLPMARTEDWIQKVHFLGLLTDEEFDRFDEEGNYKEDAQHITPARMLELEERVKLSQGKGYTPTDQSRMQTYSLGRMFMQFSRHIPSQIRERFAKEDVDVYGNTHVGSLRQVYSTAAAIVSNQMSPEKFKAYYATLKPHEKEALMAGMRGMAMVTLAGFVVAGTEQGGFANNTATGMNSDANVYSDLNRMSFKLIPPAVRSTTAITHAIFGGGTNDKIPAN